MDGEGGDFVHNHTYIFLVYFVVGGGWKWGVRILSNENLRVAHMCRALTEKIHNSNFKF